MANIKRFSYLLFLAVVFLNASAYAESSDSYSQYGNGGKKLTSASKMSRKDWNDPEELERVWQASLVRIPSDKDEYIQSTIAEITSAPLKLNKKFPTVIYLHGCSGMWPGTIRRLNLLAKNGFAVIAPPSFAREKYPQSCDPSRHVGSMYRGVIRIRLNDAGNTIAQAKQLPWVDENNVFLMGFSEGAITTARFYSKNKNRAVNARVVEGWTCNAGWQEYKGVRAPKGEPVLALVGSRDPWFQNSYNKGDCTSFLNRKNGSKSVVYKKGKLSNQHDLLEDERVQKIVIDFLQQRIK